MIINGSYKHYKSKHGKVKIVKKQTNKQITTTTTKNKNKTKTKTKSKQKQKQNQKKKKKKTLLNIILSGLKNVPHQI